jgi:hypothetical protein
VWDALDSCTCHHGEAKHKIKTLWKTIMRPARSLFLLALLSCSATVASAAQAANSEALSEGVVLRLLHSKNIAMQHVADLVAQHGVNFPLTEDVEKKLRAAGATDEVIAAIRKVAPAPSSTNVSPKSNDDVKSSRSSGSSAHARSANTTVSVDSPEVLLWKSVENSQRPEDYRGYLAAYPNGIFSSLASSRLEAMVWSKVENSQDTDQLENYLEEFPNGAHVTAARGRIQKLHWTVIEKSSDVYDFKKFLKEFPNSKYSDAAKERIDELEWAAVSGSRDPDALKAYVDSHPGGRFSAAAEKVYADLLDEKGKTFAWTRVFDDCFNTWGQSNGVMKVNKNGIQWRELVDPGKNFSVAWGLIEYQEQDNKKRNQNCMEIDIGKEPRREEVFFTGDDGKAAFLEAVGRFKRSLR